MLKKTVYDKSVAKVNNIDTSWFVLNTDKLELKNKIPHVTDFVKKAKLTESENKIPDISNLATKTALTTVEKKTNLMLVIWLKKKIIIQKLLKLIISLITIIMINILILKC